MLISVLTPFTVSSPSDLLPWAGLVTEHGAHRLWTAQAVTSEPHQAFSHLAGAGVRVPVGVGVTLMPLRHPFDAALQAASLARQTGPVLIGYGPGTPHLQAMLRGRPYESPLTACREYLEIVRGLLRGQSVEVAGRYFSCHGPLRSGPHPPVEVGLGVLREKMARLAGEMADVAVTWMTPASYLEDEIVPALQAGAGPGRSRPRLVAMLPLALDGRGRDAASMANASNRAHLSTPHYLDMLRRAGIDALSASSPLAAAQAAVDGGAFLFGDGPELVDRIDEFRRAGVDELVLNVTGVLNRFGPAAALSELTTILTLIEDSQSLTTQKVM